MRTILLILFIATMQWAAAQPDSTRYQSFEGKVVDVNTGDPILFVNIYLRGTNLGTVSNTEGEFIIKIPTFIEDQVISISTIGYKNLEIPVTELQPEGNLIELEPNPIPIEQVTIINREARALLEAARARIPENYSREPVMMTAFYRESIRQNRSYVSVSEAVLDCYKSSYTSLTDNDRVKIFKGRKSTDVKKVDTLMLKLQGGPRTMFLLDIVKNPMELLDRELMDDYRYEMRGVVSIDDRQAYVVEFKQREHIDLPLYTGKIYIGMEDLSIMGAEFQISPEKIRTASQFLVTKKPLGVNVNIDRAYYLVNYRYNEGKWYLNYVRSELELSIRWRRKLFGSNYHTLAEMAITDMDKEDITRFRFRESTKRSDILADIIADFEDPDFWGEYNIIQPEESILTAIDRLSRRLQRQNR